MFVLYAFLVACVFVAADLIYIKTFQLESYKLKNYLNKAARWAFAWGRKTPLVFTNRIKRLFFCDFLLKFCIFLFIFGVVPFFWLNFVLTILLAICSPFFVLLSFLLVLPIENQIKKSFITKAQKKLKNCNCKVIAITGSFGKTSTKNILLQILQEEFSVTASPASFNTPMGVCKTILQNLKETDDFLILEFGARQKGDIETLAKMVGVDFGIITPIGGCHLETFGSLKNIEDTKFELCENAKDVVVFNGKNKSTKKLYARFKRNKILVCEENSYAFVKNAASSSSGSTFTLVLQGKEIFCKTSLLGVANLDNITVAAAMAHLLGESELSIQKAIEKLKPTPHRLELIKGQFVDVIDDSYNSNLEGFKQALSVLSGFGGKKIVVSPGIVELGKAQFRTNEMVGQEVAKAANFFVVMNQTNKKALVEGAKKGGMQKEQILFANTREEQTALLKEILSQGDVVLFENDFPDSIK